MAAHRTSRKIGIVSIALVLAELIPYLTVTGIEWRTHTPSIYAYAVWNHVFLWIYNAQWNIVQLVLAVCSASMRVLYGTILMPFDSVYWLLKATVHSVGAYIYVAPNTHWQWLSELPNTNSSVHMMFWFVLGIITVMLLFITYTCNQFVMHNHRAHINH